ncbi:hypothetical protein AOLI_G00134040 [Acnodon oligacanthus]
MLRPADSKHFYANKQLQKNPEEASSLHKTLLSMVYDGGCHTTAQHEVGGAAAIDSMGIMHDWLYFHFELQALLLMSSEVCFYYQTWQLIQILPLIFHPEKCQRAAVSTGVSALLDRWPMDLSGVTITGNRNGHMLTIGAPE